MKKDVHPTYHTDVTVTCACGNTFVTGSIASVIKLDICSNCHPFYTGQQKFVDTEGKVDKFVRQREQALTQPVASKRKLKQKKGRIAVRSDRSSAAKTLKQMIDDVRKH